MADRRGRGADIHLHEPGEIGLHRLDQIRGRRAALRLGALAALKQRLVRSHGSR